MTPGLPLIALVDAPDSPFAQEIRRLNRCAQGLEFDGRPIFRFHRHTAGVRGSLVYGGHGYTFDWQHEIANEEVWTADRRLAGGLRTIEVFDELAALA